MEAFVGPRPAGMEINHKNCDKRDNRLANLEYVSPADNREHAKLSGRYAAKLTDEQVIDIRKSKEVSRALAERLGVSVYTVRKIRSKSMGKRHCLLRSKTRRGAGRETGAPNRGPELSTSSRAPSLSAGREKGFSHQRFAKQAITPALSQGERENGPVLLLGPGGDFLRSFPEATPCGNPPPQHAGLPPEADDHERTRSTRQRRSGSAALNGRDQGSEGSRDQGRAALLALLLAAALVIARLMR